MASDLPFHPLLTHPHTGHPLQAVGIVRGRPVWPILGAAEGDEPEGGNGGESPSGGAEPEFPANTPVAEMTDKQAAAYWKAQSRKHEGRSKAFGTLTAEELSDLRAKAQRQDELEHELSSEADKKASEARKQAESEKDAHYRPLLAETAFRVAIGDRKNDDEITDFLADLNMARFITDDGRVDTAKVRARVEQFAPATGTQQQPRKGPTVTGHGAGNGGSKPQTSGVSGGRDLWNERNPSRAVPTA